METFIDNSYRPILVYKLNFKSEILTCKESRQNWDYFKILNEYRIRLRLSETVYSVGNLTQCDLMGAILLSI
jgi:hypothetical protein